MRWLGGIFGTLLLVLGVFTSEVELKVNAAFQADPACTASITLATPARSGPICVVYHGSISRTYTTYGTKGSRSHHVVVMTDAGDSIEIELELEFWSQVFARATPGSRAVVETVKGAAAYLATSTGSLSGIGDPRSGLVATVAITAAGALMLFRSLRPRRRSAARPAAP